MIRRGLFHFLLLILLFALLAPDDALPATPRGRECGVWCEFLFWEQRCAPLELPALREALPGLAAARAELHMAIRPDRLVTDPALDAKVCRFLRRADELGVAVRAWIVLPDDLGYWSSDTNAEQTALRCVQVMDWIVARGLRCRWLIIDLEPSVQLTGEMARLSRRGEYLALAGMLIRSLDGVGFAAARERYVRLVGEIHGRGFKVMAVTYPHVVEGVKLGLPWVEDALDIPTSGIPWDQVSFMVYRTVFADLLGTDQGPGLVRTYARDALGLFGPGSAIDVGLVGETFYDDPRKLAEDRGAVDAGGLARTHVFSLEGMLRTGGVSRWLTPCPVPNSGAGLDLRWLVSETIRFAIALARALLCRK